MGFEGGEFGEQGFAMAMRFDGLGDVSNGSLDGGQFLLEGFYLVSVGGGKREVILMNFFEQALQVGGVIEEDGEFVDHFGLEGFGGDGFEVAVAATFGAGAGVAGIGGTVALTRGHAPEGGATASTVGDAREEVGGEGGPSARVMLGDRNMLTVRVKREDLLDRVPGGQVNDGGTVVSEGGIPKFENADVEFVGEEGAVGVERAVDARLVVDLLEAGACGFHFEGGADAWNPIGVGDPAMVDALFACA